MVRRITVTAKPFGNIDSRTLTKFSLPSSRPVCNIHDAVMSYRVSDGIWACSQDGCNMVAEPKDDPTMRLGSTKGRGDIIWNLVLYPGFTFKSIKVDHNLYDIIIGYSNGVYGSVKNIINSEYFISSVNQLVVDNKNFGLENFDPNGVLVLNFRMTDAFRGRVCISRRNIWTKREQR